MVLSALLQHRLHRCSIAQRCHDCCSIARINTGSTSGVSTVAAPSAPL
jgi:hypothetical protein